jgi:hypothetical protein
MKKLLCLIGLTAFASIEAKEPWQCDSLGKMFCAQNQTCCRSRVNASGWECFPTIRGVCCSNGINCCPDGTICDLTAKTCVKKTLSFLTTPETAPEMLPSTEPIRLSESPIVPAGLFLDGFFKGFDLFAHVAEGNTCLSNQEFGNYIADVLNRLKDAKIDANFLKFVEELVKDFVAHKDLVLSEVLQCKQLGANVQAVFEKLSLRVMQADFVKKVSTHALLHVLEIKAALENLQVLAKDAEYELLGKASGELVKFVFFWDLSDAEKLLLLN